MTPNVTPPLVPRWLAQSCLRGDVREAVLGDLEERLRADVAQGASIAAARRRYGDGR